MSTTSIEVISSGSPRYDEAHGFGAEKGAVRLPFGVQRIAAGRAGRLARFCRAAAFEVEHVLVREGGGDDLDQLAGRRREPGEPSDAAALGAAVAEHLELHDVLAVMDGRGPIERDARGPGSVLDIDMDRRHRFLHP